MCYVIRYVILLILFSASASAATICPDKKRCVINYEGYTNKSVYSEGDKCTKPLLSDGVCPDYLTGGCALRGDCERVQRLTVLYSDNKQ